MRVCVCCRTHYAKQAQRRRSPKQAVEAGRIGHFPAVTRTDVERCILRSPGCRANGGRYRMLCHSMPRITKPRTL